MIRRRKRNRDPAPPDPRPSLGFAVVEPLELFRAVIRHVLQRDSAWLLVHGRGEKWLAKLPDDVANLSQFGAPPFLLPGLLQVPLRPDTAEGIAERLLPVVVGGLGDIYVDGNWVLRCGHWEEYIPPEEFPGGELVLGTIPSEELADLLSRRVIVAPGKVQPGTLP